MDKKVEVGTQSGVYSGNIKLTLKKGNTPYKTIKQKNKGTVEFFKYILNSVKGEILPNDRPAHVKLVYKYDDIEIVSKYGVLYESVTSAEDTGSSEAPKATIRYSFLIPETVVERGVICGLQLESVNGVIYARVNFPEVVTITNNTNIELDWDLNICNG